jgi:mono/diheme cytochrome c family protein
MKTTQLLNIFAPESTPANAIVELSMLVLSITAVIFLVVASLLVYAIVKFRATPANADREPAQVYSSTQIELAWTIVPVLIVLVLFAATALGMIWGGRIQLETPMLFSIGFLFQFLIAGLTGVIMMASAPFDWQLSLSYFVVAHFHYIIVGGILFALFAAFYYWYPKVTGRMLSERLGTLHALVEGIRSRWSRPAALAGANPPSYAATSAGDIHRGAAAYQTFCQSCHGADGQGGPNGSAITNDSFLALASDQALRTIVLVGRPELGAPDWRGNVAGRPMSDQEVTDVVSWLSSHRVAAPGQPYVAERQR